MRTIKAWITVTEYAKMPRVYGEYFTKKPKHYSDNELKEVRIIIEK